MCMLDFGGLAAFLVILGWKRHFIEWCGTKIDEWGLVATFEAI